MTKFKFKIDTDPQYFEEVENAATVLVTVFRTFGWTWGDSDTPPNYNQMKNHIADQVDNAIKSYNKNNDYTGISSGRTGVRILNDEGHLSAEIYLNLSTIYEEGK